MATLPTFCDAYRQRRCILPVDGFFEWKAIKGKAKQPYAIAMREGYPFGIGGVWENWKHPTSGEWIRTFAIITTDANELVAEIHDACRRSSLGLIMFVGSAMNLTRMTCCDHIRRRRCGCGRSPRASISRRTMIRRSCSRSSCQQHSYIRYLKPAAAGQPRV